MSKPLLGTLLFFVFSSVSFSQSKSISAIKINQSIKIDGNPDDIVWQRIPAVSDFTTSTPVFGNKA
ncbi:MAG: hypothetical protein ABIR50_04000, partial [Ginsengibacter sp.]